ncbi:hypothetical protein GCM10010441_60390 [Kitasatospora paracochleata]|uniref:Uncharacterized protein n=1 Tax=Kitasatospora paracochleata TaxID=58354 RepID=A0ABT1IVB8_9ACTN|nr:hypothetical protein [Kitasatospora paracochleata]MCP2309085.1 hypothetical protein [Kitasatospora paracochleata]
MATAPGPSRSTRWTVSRLARAVHRAGAPQPSPAPDRTAQLTALAVVLADASAEQPLADWAVAACGEAGPVAATVAQTAGRQAARYSQLAGRLRALPADGEVAALRERALRLVAYHQWMLRQCANLAFTTHPDERTEEARRRINGLGAPGNRLRELHEQVRAEAARALEETARF